jgi:uncharacterized protein YkwD
MVTLPDPPQAEIAIVQMTNAFRREQKLGALVSNGKLSAAARAYAGYLARTGTLSHTADGRSMDARVRAQGYTFCWLAENLSFRRDAKGFAPKALADTVVTGWRNSPGHRANMASPNVTEIGVGVARAPGPTPTYYSVQLMGRPPGKGCPAVPVRK